MNENYHILISLPYFCCNLPPVVSSQHSRNRLKACPPVLLCDRTVLTTLGQHWQIDQRYTREAGPDNIYVYMYSIDYLNTMWSWFVFWFYQIKIFILNSQNIFLFRKFYCVNKFPEIELKFGKIDKIKMFWIWNLCVEKSVTISHSMIGQKEYRILVEFCIYIDYRRLQF